MVSINTIHHDVINGGFARMIPFQTVIPRDLILKRIEGQIKLQNDSNNQKILMEKHDE